MTSLREFFSLPIGSRGVGRDTPVGMDELGRTVYRDQLGYDYVVAEIPSENALARMIDQFRESPSNALLDLGRALVQGAWNGIEAPGNALRGEPVTYGDVADTALDWGIMGAFNRAPEGSLRIFAGRNAQTADTGALQRAQDMAQAGASRDDIWRDTGWFQGVDGQWRFEIDDSAAGFRTSLRGQPESGNLQRSFSHPELYEAYSFPDTSVYPSTSGFRAGTGSYTAPEYWDVSGPHFNAGDVRTPGRVNVRGANLDDLNSVTLHELQHAVQAREGFGYGSNLSDEAAAIAARRDGELRAAAFEGAAPEDLAAIRRHEELRAQWQGRSEIPAEIQSEVQAILARPGVQEVLARLDGLRDMRRRGQGGALEGGLVSREDAFDAYRRVSGEVEARNVQTRRDFTPEQRRATPPWATQDVPDADQIVRMGGGTPSLEALQAYIRGVR